MSLNTQYNIVAKDTEVTKATLKAVADASVNDELLFSTFADFLADDFLQKVVVSSSMIRGPAGFLAEIAERHVRGGDKVFHWSGGDLRRPRRSKIQPVVRHSFVLRTKGSRRDVCRGSLRGGSAICFQ